MPQHTGSVLVVTPDDAVRLTCKGWLNAEGLEVHEARTGTEALEFLSRSSCSLTISDAHLPECDGIELIHRIQQLDADAQVALVADGGPDMSAAALEAGAIGFIQRPVERPRLIDLTKMVMARLSDTTRRSKAPHRGGDFSNIIAHSESMRRVVELAAQAAPLDCTVLITGHSGTGKEVLARAIHANSLRSGETFAPINCAAIPDGLLESELFGYDRSAFAGAISSKEGLIAKAAGGTVFLDEIAEIARPVQKKLLDFLETSTYLPIGMSERARSDVRVIAATNTRLEEKVREGEFSEELYYKLCVFPLHVPSLADRVDDIVPLAQHFLTSLEGQIGRAAPGLSREAIRYLTTRIWRGNVRELRNAIERAVIVSRNNQLTSADFRGLDAMSPHTTGESAAARGELWTLPAEGIDLEALNRSLTEQALERTRNKVSPAARLLGVSRATLRYRIRKYGFDKHPVRLSGSH